MNKRVCKNRPSGVSIIAATHCLLLAMFFFTPLSVAQLTDDITYGVAHQVAGETVDDFEGVQPSFQLAPGDSLAILRRHARTDQAPYAGRRCEYVSLVAHRGGERILATRDIPPVAAIEELQIRMAVRGNRGGYQMMARVRLPRVQNEDGEPAAVYVFGDRYEKAPHWQELIVADFEQQVANQVRAMRVKSGYVDAGEAYVDQVGINLYGGADANRIWLDELRIQSGIRVHPRGDRRETSIALANFTKDVTPKRSSISISGKWVPRIARLRNQSFTSLQKSGFNTVWLEQSPTDEQLNDANKLGLKLISPPPTDLAITAKYGNVVAWFLDAATVERSPQLVRMCREQDSLNRPLVSLGPQPWSDIEVLPAHDARRDVSKTVWLSPAAGRWLPLRSQIREGAFAGCSGFLLDLPNSGQVRAYDDAVARLFNLELSNLRPWILRRSNARRIRPLRQSDRLTVSGLSCQHGDLVWVRTKGTNETTAYGEQFLDLPDANYQDAFFLEPGNLEPVKDRRVAGGMRLKLLAEKPDGLLLLTSKPQIWQAWKVHLDSIRDDYLESLLQVIQHELLYLDRKLGQPMIDRNLAVHLRREVHALHGRIAPLLEQSGSQPNFRELDHLLGQLERVHTVLHPVMTK